MKNKTVIKYLICVMTAIILAVLLLYAPIFKIESCSMDKMTTDIYANEQNCMCILRYSYTTGAGWAVMKTNVPELVGQNVYLYNIFDPRLLKDNKEFDLDYLAKYIVVIDNISTIVVEDEEAYVIKPKNITVVYDTNKRKYSLKDLSFKGIIKSLLSIVNKKYRYSY